MQNAPTILRLKLCKLYTKYFKYNNQFMKLMLLKTCFCYCNGNLCSSYCHLPEPITIRDGLNLST